MRWKLLAFVGTMLVAAETMFARGGPPDAGSPPQVPGFVEVVAGAVDPGAIAAGKEAFGRSCATCHDADRSTGQSKDLAAWRTVVLRMAQKPGADVPAEDVEGIAAYLASLCPPAHAGADNRPSAFTAFGTVSPLWRGGNPNIQNNGFFPELFIGGQWQQANGPLSARVTACTTCHGAGEPGFIQRVELVEAVVRADISKFFGGCPVAIRGAVEAGRFVVPFGAFSSQVNPGVYRTVSKPLIFNMGQRAQDGSIGDPVLPMPYSDQGASINLAVPFGDGLTATMDAYVVNGLKGDENGIDFDRTRDMVDNNGSPATGGRLTFGNQYVRVGGSAMGGRFNDRPISGPYEGGMRYFVWGVDCVAHYKDIVRFQAEYAHRGNDRVLADDAGNLSRSFDRVGGYYLEAEVRPREGFPLSLLARYDRQARNDATPPDGSALDTGAFTAQRFTWGLNYQLFNRSLLMLNHEHWFMPTGMHDVDVLGVRYAVTF